MTQGKLICNIAPGVKCGRMFWRSHFKVKCSEICEHSYKTAQETTMMTWSDRKMNERTIWWSNKLQLLLHHGTVLVNSLRKAWIWVHSWLPQKRKKWDKGATVQNVYLGPPSEVSGYTGIDKKQELGQTKGISALILRRWRTEELSVDLEIAIII